MEFAGAFYPGVSFARQMTELALQEEAEEGGVDVGVDT